MHTKVKAGLLAIAIVGSCFTTQTRLYAGIFQGRVFDLEGGLLDKEVITVRAVVGGAIIAEAKSDSTGSFKLDVPNGVFVGLRDKEVRLDFVRRGAITRSVQGLVGNSDKPQTIDATVPGPDVPCGPYYCAPHRCSLRGLFGRR